MNTDIRIREATIEDLPMLLQYEQEVIKAERPLDPTIKSGAVTYYDLEALISNPRAMVLVACDEHLIVATGYAIEKQARLYLDHDAYAYLGFMYTKPDYRGRGINAEIIKGLQDWASTLGLIEIRLSVYSENTPALRAYEKVGFKNHMVEMRLRTKS